MSTLVASRGVTVDDARLRQLVRLPDGRTGRLVHVTPNSCRATVLVGGRRVRIAAAELTPIPDLTQGAPA